jgi:hypothetical protein
MRSYKSLLVLGVLVATTMVGGCSRGPKLAAVTGQVTWNGQPVPFAYVVFQPVEPPGAYGAAYTDAEGRYELLYTKSKRGALVGRHEVTVRTSSLDEIQVEDRKTGLMVTPPLPAGYKPKAQAQFEREVASGGNEIDLDLATATAAAQPQVRR